MQRIVKRFLLHKQRETDEVGETDFDELKQDLQMVRYEMINDLKKSREETLKLIHHISSGLIIIGEELFSTNNSKNSHKFKEFSSTDFEFYDNFTELKITEPSTSKDLNNNYNNLNNMLNVKNNHSNKDNTNLDSLGSSSDTQSGNSEPTTEIIQVNSSPSSETDSILNSLKSSAIIDLIDNKKINVLSNNTIKELESVSEEPAKNNQAEINTDSIIIIEHMEQGVQTIYNNDDNEDDDELNQNDKMYII